jgi:two-component system alkaline phosphatase synthesis response regulator PhoP
MKPRVLACDDATVITRAISLKLTRSGYDVETVSDGLLGWEAAQRELPDLIITDYQMPRMDGLELIAKLRSDERTRGVPVILLTAKGFELNDRDLIERFGLTAVLAKPFSPAELAQLVAQSLNTAIQEPTEVSATQV